MPGPTPYLQLPGTAREALTFYRDVFGGELALFTYAQFNREDGPAEAIAHGELRGPVAVSASDAAGDEPTVRIEGVLFALLGTADPATLQTWFDRLCEGGTDVDPLQQRPWGAHDGQVTDRYGLRWLVGYED